MEKPYTLTAGPKETAEVAPRGQFTLIRPFVLRGPKTNGFIIQLIERQTTVAVHRAGGIQILRSSNEVSSFTSGNVLNASDNYYEIFLVENGRVLDRDQFQGGQVLRYVATGPDSDPPTSGEIIIRGTSVFVPAGIEDMKRAMGAAEGVATRSMTRVKALGWSWDAFSGTPANGLPYLPGDAALSLDKLSASNTLVRVCRVKWTADGHTALSESTDPPSPKVYVTTGGRRRKSSRGRTASKSYRTRGTGRAKSRSSRRARVRRYRTVRRGSGMSR